MVKSFCRLVTTVIVTVVFASGCTPGGGDEVVFATFEDARNANAIGNWLPSWLPEDATNIRERHRVDLPVAWIRFEIPDIDSNDDVLKLGQCVSATAQDLRMVSELAEEAPRWWPNELRDLTSESTEMMEWSLYKCGSDLLALSVGDIRTEAYAWRLAGEFAIEETRTWGRTAV